MANSPSDRVTRSPKIPEIVARRIVDEIASQDLQPGDMLPSESAMLERYGVGRSSLREALLLLEVLGLIARKPGLRGGPVVAGVSAHDFGRVLSLYLRISGVTYRQLIEARLIIQPMSARMAAERQSPELLASLEAVMGAAEEADLADDATYLATVVDFHGAIASVSGNPIMGLFARALADLYAERLSDALPAVNKRREVLRIYEGIAEAIFARDPDEAERLATEHMEGTMRRLNRRVPDLLDRQLDWH